MQHAGVLGAVIEHQEVMWLAGEKIDETALLAAVNCQRRLLETVGLQRRAREVTPSIASYSRGRAAEAAE